MSTDPEQIRAEIDSLLAGLPDVAAAGAGLDLEAVAARLAAAHDLLVRALDSVEAREDQAQG
ncbi:MAG: hypothetical protein JO044_19295 [Mycobacteriaceae bacterium]|nr:hypothetical protein [Mycobacteriaceae bacterium]MBV9639905.1 hypothetical protein [Mycobacteriaceae bacterium]